MKEEKGKETRREGSGGTRIAFVPSRRVFRMPASREAKAREWVREQLAERKDR